MKYLLMFLVLLGVALGAFYAGTVYGIGEGREVQRWGGGMMRAENARRVLLAMEKGDVDLVKGMEGEELREALLDHYQLMHHPRRFPMPAGAYMIFAPGGNTGEPYDRRFGSRIVAYVKDHPEAGKFSTALDPARMPADTDEHRASRDQLSEGMTNMQRQLDWVLDYYAKQPAAQ